MDTYKYPK